MPKQVVRWAPIVLALLIAGALGFGIDALFGGDVGSYVSAASSIVLVGVTFSYVLATFDLAKSATDQVTLARGQRSIETTIDVWDAFSDLGSTAQDSWHYMLVLVTSDSVDMNYWASYDRQKSQRRLQLLRGFVHRFRRSDILLPEAVRLSGRLLCDELQDIAYLEETLTDAIADELARSVNSQEAFDWEQVWGADMPFLANERTWHDIAQQGASAELNRRVDEFRKSVAEVADSIG